MILQLEKPSSPKRCHRIRLKTHCPVFFTADLVKLGPCLSSHVADQSFKTAKNLQHGKPLPHRLFNSTPTNLNFIFINLIKIQAFLSALLTRTHLFKKCSQCVRHTSSVHSVPRSNTKHWTFFKTNKKMTYAFKLHQIKVVNKISEYILGKFHNT
jgi:hypothetical protein